MAKVFVSIALIWTFSNSTQTMTNPIRPYELPSYEVYKIDSINSYFLVFARRDDSLFEIVSKKDNSLDCKKIRVGQQYNLALKSLWSEDRWVGNLNVKPSLTPHVTCLRFDDSTSICIDREHGIYDLFLTPSLTGLFYIGASK
jgi:hypothetical protein